MLRTDIDNPVVPTAFSASKTSTVQSVYTSTGLRDSADHRTRRHARPPRWRIMRGRASPQVTRLRLCCTVNEEDDDVAQVEMDAIEDLEDVSEGGHSEAEIQESTVDAASNSVERDSGSDEADPLALADKSAGAMNVEESGSPASVAKSALAKKS